MAFVIGLSGRKQSGKNSSADHIISRMEQVGRTARIFAFADPMKRVCMQFFGLTHEQCWGTDEAKNSFTDLLWEDFPVIIPEKSGHMTAREVLQYFGTEILRKMYTQAHVHATFFEINESNVDVALLADVRFPNEVDATLQEGKVLRLTRVVFPDDNHASECSLDADKYDWRKFSGVISNQGLTVSEQNIVVDMYLRIWGLI
jgi:hypothetical protein